jgi:transcriptional regulator with XRE-family HTH domain
MNQDKKFTQLGERLEQIIKEHGKSQAQFASEYGLNANSLSQNKFEDKLRRSLYTVLLKIGYNPDWVETGKGERYIPVSETMKVEEPQAPYGLDPTQKELFLCLKENNKLQSQIIELQRQIIDSKN